MSSEMVTIGCKLPHGLILELGYEVVKKDGDGPNARDYTSVQKMANYARVQIRGSSHADGSRKAYATGLFLPAQLAPSVGITQVSKDFWDAWKKAHPQMVKRLAGQLFEYKDEAGVRAQGVDAVKVPTSFEPADPTKLKTPGVVKFDPDLE